MRVKILHEAGYEVALFGIGFSHGVTNNIEYKEDFTPMSASILAVCGKEDKADKLLARYRRMQGVAGRLAPLDRGHNTFLAMIGAWLDIQAPRYWWQEADRYKVGTVLQSESTMHTIHTRAFSKEMFQDEDIPDFYLTHLNILREAYLETKDKEIWRKIIKDKPESFLQRRILYCNYMNLRNIIIQRKGHKLQEWALFIESIHAQCQHPELLP